MQLNPFHKIVIATLPRVFSSLDQNPLSSSFGCFDKNYWCYKTSDFSCARFQEGSLILALLYSHNFKGNTYYKKSTVKDLAIAALDFWTTIQNKDGSFDEWYPNERSFVATAFSLYKSAETFILLQDCVKNKNKYLRAFEKAADWLISNKEQVANQSIGAMLAVYNVFSIIPKKKYQNYIRAKISEIRKLQSDEGWFNEYGGVDLGYLSLALEYLAVYHSKTKDKTIKQIIDKILDFYVYFVHPDGSVGGVYASRNTEFKFPYGFCLMAQKNKKAAYVLNSMRSRILETTNPLFMDDRFALQYLDSFLFSALQKNNKAAQPSVKKESIKIFPKSGLLVKSSPYSIVINLKKGGVFRLFSGNKQLASDSGLFGRFKNKIITTQWLNSSTYEVKGNKIIIKGKFKKLCPAQKLTPFMNVLLRCFLITLGKISFFSKLFKKIMRGKLILNARDFPLEYRREIYLDSQSVRVVDFILNKKNLGLGSLFLAENLKSVYVPTSNFFNGRLDKFKKIRLSDKITTVKREYKTN